MNSYDFEKICKNALIKILKDKYGEDYKIQDFHIVWFSKSLQNYKCTICDLRPTNKRYYECTYNGDKKQLYVDVYNKEHNVCVEETEFNTEVEE